jgi:plastocyanin
MNFARYTTAILSFVVLAACGGGSDSTGPGTTTGGNGGGGGNNCPTGAVCFLSATFSPNALTVAKGTTVSFVNNSGIEHTLNFDGTRPPGVDDIGLNNSGTFTRTFNDAGTFKFHCAIHAGMTGAITVQ